MWRGARSGGRSAPRNRGEQSAAARLETTTRLSCRQKNDQRRRVDKRAEIAAFSRVNNAHPSAKFSLRDELRLLDEALDEARARPRPPSPATGPALSRVTHPALKHVSIQAALSDAEPNRATNGHLAPSESQTASRQEVSPEDAGANIHKLSDDGHQVNGHRVTTYNLLDSEEEVVVDRKRLLAAIICILQEELTRSKPTGG